MESRKIRNGKRAGVIQDLSVTKLGKKKSPNVSIEVQVQHKDVQQSVEPGKTNNASGESNELLPE
jgi:hypothetical protein